MVSGGTSASTSAPLAGVPAAQSNTAPEIRVRGIAVPVEKNVDAPMFRTLPRMSASPRMRITVYGVLARQPWVGFTPTASRCQDASGTPSRGEIKNKSDSDVTDAGRSDTTSSNLNSTSFGFTPTAPESGVMPMIWGAAMSGGPPGGMPG